MFHFVQDCCLIPESPFYLEGRGGLFEYIEKRLKDNGHMVIVVAEGAGQELIADSVRSMGHEDASGNKLLLDVGLWLSQKIKVRSTTLSHDGFFFLYYFNIGFDFLSMSNASSQGSSTFQRDLMVTINIPKTMRYSCALSVTTTLAISI